MKKEIKRLKEEIAELKEDIVELKENNEHLNDRLEDTEDIDFERLRLEKEIEALNESVVLESPDLMELQKAELLKIAQSKFTLQELEERFGFNSANHDVN